MRIIFYTGKGGVGKTSTAAATACKLASEGNKVLIMSTDQAHSLGDSLDCELSYEPKQAAENLWAMEVDTVRESEKAWGKLHGYMKELLSSHANGGLETEELLVFPGLEELFSLFKILEFYDENKYDVIIVDCAPTGETLSLLKFPEQLGGFLDKMLPAKRKMVKIAGPAVEKFTKIPMPKDDVFDDLTRLMRKMERMQELMDNKKVVSLRIVTTPERIVIQEAKHNFTCLHLYGYLVDAVIVNRIYPTQALEGYFSKWIQLQEESLTQLKESFGQIPILMLELQERELRGISSLTQAAELLYGKINPMEILFDDKIMCVEKENGQLVLNLSLPFAEKEDIDLTVQSGELILKLKNEKRRFMVPDNLKGKEIEGARYEDGWLKVCYSRDREPSCTASGPIK